MSKSSEAAYFYDKLDVGILIVDEALTILFMNNWVRRRIPKMIYSLFDLFEKNDRIPVEAIVKNVIKHNIPRVLSQAFHQWIIPLPDNRFDDKRMRQGGVITQVCYKDTKAALIQIRDESDTVLRIQNLKQIQDKLSEKAKELETYNIELQKNQIELTKAKNQAEAASRVKNEFLSSMSHELRTPLNVINGFAQLLKMCDNITSEQKNQIDMIEQSGNTLLTLINHVLELVKIESGTDLYEPSEVYLKSFLKEICQIADMRSRKKGIQFIQKIDPKLPIMIQTDIHKLHCALMAIIDNAVKFTKKGSITLEVKAGDRKIHFEIRDTGVGIPEDKLDKIFVAFPERTEYRKDEGAGIGLAVSRKLIKIIGGTLEAVSLPGRGSSFSFDIDATECQPIPESIVVEQIKGYKGTKRTILVAEDEPLSRKMLCKILTLFGFDIIDAENGEDCIDKAIQHRPDLIFMDITMPKIDGLEACTIIKKNPALASVPIIAVSGHLGKEIYNKCKASGLDDIIYKPLNAADLLAQCEKYLNLEWIKHEKPPGTPVAKPDPPEHLSLTNTFPFPPPEQCRHLIEFARLGDIREFKQALKSIEQSDEAYRPFIQTVSRFLKQYDMKEIIKMLEKNLNE